MALLPPVSDPDDEGGDQPAGEDEAAPTEVNPNTEEPSTEIRRNLRRQRPKIHPKAPPLEEELLQTVPKEQHLALLASRPGAGLTDVEQINYYGSRAAYQDKVEGWIPFVRTFLKHLGVFDRIQKGSIYWEEGQTSSSNSTAPSQGPTLTSTPSRSTRSSSRLSSCPPNSPSSAEPLTPAPKRRRVQNGSGRVNGTLRPAPLFLSKAPTISPNIFSISPCRRCRSQHPDGSSR